MVDGGCEGGQTRGRRVLVVLCNMFSQSQNKELNFLRVKGKTMLLGSIGTKRVAIRLLVNYGANVSHNNSGQLEVNECFRGFDVSFIINNRTYVV